MIKDKLSGPYNQNLKKPSTGANANQVLPLPDQLRLEKTLSGGLGSQNEGLQKIIQMLPTELWSRTMGQDRK